MKKIIYLLLFTSISSFAQNIPFKTLKSEVFKDEYRDSQIVVSEQDENGGVLIVRSYKSSGISSNRGYYFEHYDSNLKLLNDYTFQIEHTISQKKATVLGVFRLSDKIRIIEMFYDITDKSYICIANSINVNDFVLEKKELFRLKRDEIEKKASFSLNEINNENREMKSVINGSFGSEKDRNPFALDGFLNSRSGNVSSLDGNSKIALVVNKEKNSFCIALNFNKKSNSDSNHVKIYLFDEELNKKIEKDLNKDTIDKKEVLQNISLSADGNSIYLLSKVYSKNKEEKEAKYQFEMTKFTENNIDFQKFDTKEHFIGSLKTIVMEDKIICIGFYSDYDDKRYKGVSYFELEPQTLAVKKSKFNDFSEQFILDKYGKIKDKELKYLNFKSLLTTDKNELIFNAEESYITYTSTMGPNGYSSSYSVSHYDDIVSIKIDAEGNLLWSRNINKKQGGDSNFVSYTSSLINNDAYFFINASEKIKNLDNNRVEFRDTSKNNYNLNLIRINPNGDFEYQEIINNEENEVPFMVSNGIQSGNSVIFLGKKGAKKQLLKVSL